MKQDGAETIRLGKTIGHALETHLLVPLFTVLMLGLIWLATAHLIKAEGATVERWVADSARELGETYEAQMIRNLGSIDQTLRIVKYAYEQPGQPFSLAALRQKNLLPSTLIFNISVANQAGDIIESTLAGKLPNIAGEPFFRAHQAEPSALPSVTPVALSNEWKLQFSRRLSTPDGGFGGIAIVSVDPVYFTSGYERSRLGDKGVLGLIGSNRVFLAQRTGDQVSWGQIADIGAQSATAGLENGDTILVTNGWDGVRRYTNSRRLYAFPLTVVVGLSYAEQLEPFERQKNTYLWAASIASLLLISIAAVLSRLSWQLNRSKMRTRKDQETYYAASEASLDAVFVLRSITNEHGIAIDFILDNVNQRGAKLFNTTKPKLLGKRLCQVLPKSQFNSILEEFAVVTQTGTVHELEWKTDMRRGQPLWLYRQVVKVEDGLVVIVRDITERKQAEQRIRHMAHHDALTGLPNRTLLEDRIQQAMLYAQRYNRCVTVVFMDLDNFKLVNDSLGHKTGDELLKTVATRMVECVRQTDTVVRLGGDEFVIVLIDQSGTVDSITPTLTKIRSALAEPMYIGGQRLEITSSMGLATYPADGRDCETLLMNADAAMYQAKALGRNNYQFYTAEMNAQVHEKLRLQEGLRLAVNREEFFLLYQPRVHVSTGAVLGVEALIRWNHPELGVVSPLNFIPLAEETGLILPIGQWVLRTACLQNKAWQDAGHRPVVVSVNVSARQFKDNNLISQVEHALRESGLEPHYLELELTESLIMQDVRQAVSIMQQLKAMGIQLSIDDFGTGYSSLSSLKSFPITRLKLDKSFVCGLPHDEDDKAIAMAIISLGQRLNLKILAEGVETLEQLAFLREYGCDEMQGYLFSKPVPAVQAVQMFNYGTHDGLAQLALLP